MKKHMMTMALMSSAISLMYGENIKQTHTPGDHVTVASNKTVSAGRHGVQAVKEGASAMGQLGGAVVHLGTAAGEEIAHVASSVFNSVATTFGNLHKDLVAKHEQAKKKQEFITRYMHRIKSIIFEAFLNALRDGRLFVEFLKNYNDMVKVQRELVEERFYQEYGY